MGGHALKNIRTDPIPLIEYEQLCRELVERLSSLFEVVEFPLNVNDKSQFGDVDLFVSYPKCVTEFNISQQVSHVLNSQEYAANSNKTLHHFEFKQRQVDIHWCIDRQDLTCKRDVYSYGYTVMLIGSLAKMFGYSYSEQGLKLKYAIPLKDCMLATATKDEKEKTTTIPIPFEFVLSQDVPVILQFFGLDVVKWKQGFENLQEIVDFVLNSRYSRLSIWQKTDVGSKRQQQTSPLLQLFNENINKKNVSSSQTDMKEIEQDIHHDLPCPLVYFGKEALYQEKGKEYYQQQQVKQKMKSIWNGQLVMNTICPLGLKQKEITEYMNFFVKYINVFHTPSSSSFDTWILQQSNVDALTSKMQRVYHFWRQETFS